MFGFRLFFPVFGLLLYQSYLVYSCTSLNGRSGTISDSYVVRGTAPYDKCWTIANPEKNLISFQLRRLDLTSKKPTDGSLQIAFKDDNKAIIYWSQSAMDSFSTTSNLTHIEFAIDSGQYRDNFVASFTLHYETIYIACSQEDSFRCSNNTCIPKNEVCDGIKNCDNGADEFGCGAVKMEGAADALSNQITWMKGKRTSFWGWNEHTSRAVVALYLAGAAKFDGKILEEELMAKQAELKTSIALLKNSLSNEQLSMFINGLLVTCHNPRHFYGQNLVKRLKEQVESTSNFTHPVAYLTLCNARETWPSRAYEDLNKMLTLNSNYPFITDFQAIATMAVSCLHNLTNFLSGTGNTDLKTSYDNAIKNFKGMQFPDGRFGNLHTTSLITQALLSSGQEFATDWKLNATMKYIIQSLTKSPDILARFLTLPVLNAASLVDVSKVNCTLNPRRSGYGNRNACQT